MELGLKDKTALVSGGTQGIGLGIALALAEEGVRTFLVARDAARLEATALELERRFGTECRWAVADYSIQGGGVRAAEKALSEFGRIDLLVNNAGRSLPLPVDAPSQDWFDGFQLNFLSHLEAIRTVSPAMKADGWGRIVNIIGTSFRSPAKVSVGTPAKYALLATSKVLSRELAPHGVTVNSVSVGKIESNQINEIYYPDAAVRDSIAREIPLGRFGQPDDVAHAVVWLASTAAAYVTGSVVTVDGGQSRTLL
jgi:3-oxoacyl-[acyl-carrier protein] reductase